MILFRNLLIINDYCEQNLLFVDGLVNIMKSSRTSIKDELTCVPSLKKYILHLKMTKFSSNTDKCL